MSKIFLSYRRQDTAGIAGRIYDRLRAHFGDDAVFMDIDDIPFGVDFRVHLDEAVGQCDVVLVVIGTKWAGETDAHRRIDDPRDFVRIEIESALERDIPVIPVLIDHTRMPAEADLPPSLARLTYRNAIDVDQGRDFHPHVDRLIKGIAFHFQRVKEAGQRSKPPSPQPRREWTNSIGMTLVRIEPGEFLMGSTKDQIDKLMKQFPDLKREGFDGEQPQDPVKITRPFYLAAHQVTVGQFRRVVESTGYRSEAEQGDKGSYAWDGMVFKPDPKRNWKNPGFVQRDDQRSPKENPQNTAKASYSIRVIRGGSWNFVVWYCRPATRWWYEPEKRNDRLGFRVAAVQE